MDGAVFSGCEIDHAILSLREVDTETTSVYKGHATFVVTFNTAEYILLVRISLSLQLH